MTVEHLLEMISRATNERCSGNAHYFDDLDYAEDALNDWLPGLGDKVRALPHDYSAAWPSDNRETVPLKGESAS